MVLSLSKYRDGNAPAASSIRHIFFASVAVFAAHNAEEFLGIAAWSQATMSEAARLSYWADRFLIAVGLLMLSYAAVVLWATRRWRLGGVLIMLLGFSTIFANALVHIADKMFIGSGFPGWITAIFLIMPIGVLIFVRLVGDGIMRWWQVPLFVASGLVLQAPLALIAIYAARLLT